MVIDIYGSGICWSLTADELNRSPLSRLIKIHWDANLAYQRKCEVHVFGIAGKLGAEAVSIECPRLAIKLDDFADCSNCDLILIGKAIVEVVERATIGDWAVWFREIDCDRELQFGPATKMSLRVFYKRFSAHKYSWKIITQINEQVITRSW